MLLSITTAHPQTAEEQARHWERFHEAGFVSLAAAKYCRDYGSGLDRMTLKLKAEDRDPQHVRMRERIESLFKEDADLACRKAFEMFGPGTRRGLYSSSPIATYYYVVRRVPRSFEDAVRPR